MLFKLFFIGKLFKGLNSAGVNINDQSFKNALDGFLKMIGVMGKIWLLLSVLSIGYSFVNLNDSFFLYTLPLGFLIYFSSAYLSVFLMKKGKGDFLGKNKIINGLLFTVVLLILNMNYFESEIVNFLFYTYGLMFVLNIFAKKQ